MELATIWNEAEDRAEVAAASDDIDRLLAEHPATLGESRGGSARIAFVGRLAIDFHVEEDDRMVTVAAVWYTQ